MKLCRICVNPSTRPNGHPFVDGVCGVCLLFEKKRQDKIDWNSRMEEILGITDWGKANSKTSYDCIVTVSGGKDSTRQAFFVRDELKLNPLLVSAVYPPEQMHERGAANLANLIEHGFDCISVGPNPIVFKQLMKTCLNRYLNLLNASEMALYSIPVHVAIAYKIPLIFLGDNPAHTVGEMHGKSVTNDASQTRKSNTLMGGKADIFLDTGLTSQDLHFYNYPSEEDVAFAKIRLVYLGYYIQDWSAYNNGQFSIKRGLQIRDDAPENTGDLFGFSALDEDFRIVNQLIKYFKLGFGHVTDQAMDMIHTGRMTREEGLSLVKKYDGKCHSKYIHKLCRYLDITETEFWKLVDTGRNKEIWIKDEQGQWFINV